jgi:hypothetical protein
MPSTSPSKGFLKKIFGKDTDDDIELPNESGKTDRRLPKKKKSQLDNISEGYSILKGFGKKAAAK